MAIGAIPYGPDEGPDDRSFDVPALQVAPPAPAAQQPPVAAPVPPPAASNPGAALSQATEALAAQAPAEQAIANAKAAETTAQADGADQQAQLADAQAEEIQARQAQQAADRQAAIDQADQAEKAFQDHTFHDYWKDKSTGQRVLAGIFSGLGAASQGLVGGANPAGDRIEANIARDFQQQKEELNKKETFARWKREGVKDLATYHQQQLGTLAIKQGKAWEQVAAQVKAQALRAGATVQQAEGNALYQQAIGKAFSFNAEGRVKLQEAQARAVDRALARQDRTDYRQDKAAADLDARTVQLEDGSMLTLPSARQAPQFVAGYQSKVNAIQKLKEYADDLRKNGNVWTPEAVERRESLRKSAVSAVASVTSMGASDHSAKIEEGTLGPEGKYAIPGLTAGAKLGVERTESVIDDLQSTIDKTVSSYRKDKVAAPKGEQESPRAAPATSLTPSKVKAALDWAKAHPKDPRAAEILARVGAK